MGGQADGAPAVGEQFTWNCEAPPFYPVGFQWDYSWASLVVLQNATIAALIESLKLANQRAEANAMYGPSHCSGAGPANVGCVDGIAYDEAAKWNLPQLGGELKARLQVIAAMVMCGLAGCKDKAGSTIRAG